jgi:ubiquinone/menaquinone biosynthesis C-methylase UbiE
MAAASSSSRTGTRPPTKRFKLLPEMEGSTARWYAKLRSTAPQIALCRARAAELTADLPAGATVLEIAPGPGLLAIELARDGRFQVSGLDISPTFVGLATEKALAAGVRVDFQRGDVASMPFASDTFDLIVCQAAFKNFMAPGCALDEMYRVLRLGGCAVIEDLDRDASREAIAREVSAMQLTRVSAFTTKLILSTLLRRRAYSTQGFERLIAASGFHTGAIRKVGVGLEVRLTKQAEAGPRAFDG